MIFSISSPPGRKPSRRPTRAVTQRLAGLEEKALRLLGNVGGT